MNVTCWRAESNEKLTLFFFLILSLNRTHTNFLIIPSRAVMSLWVSENSPSSILSPTYQWTKAPLAYYQVKFVVQLSSGLSNGWGIAEHTHSSLEPGKVSTRYNRKLVINANREASVPSIYKLDAALGLDGGKGSIDIFGNHGTMVKQAASYVLTMMRVTIHHLVCWLKASTCWWFLLQKAVHGRLSQ